MRRRWLRGVVCGMLWCESLLATARDIAPNPAPPAPPPNLVVSASAIGCAAETPCQGRFSALSYNVAGLPGWISRSRPAVFTAQISPKLNAYDLVIVQEDFWYHDALIRDARQPFRTAPQKHGFSLINDGLARLSVFPITGSTREQWQTCNGFFGARNDCLAPKGFSFAVHVLAPGVLLHVYNVHSDAGADALDAAARKSQFAQLVAFMTQHSPRAPVLVGGDTNLSAARPGDVQTLRAFTSDAHLVEVGPLFGADDHLDRFFFRSTPELTLTPTSWQVAPEFVTAESVPLSDHAPIRVEFLWQR